MGYPLVYNDVARQDTEKLKKVDEKRKALSRIKGDQAKGEEQNSCEENGYVTDLPHKRLFVLLVHTGDDDHGSVICQQEIGGSRKDVREGKQEQQGSGDHARDDEELFGMQKGKGVGYGFDAA